MRAALADGQCAIVRRATVSTRREGAEALIEQIYALIEEVIQGAEITTIGVGAPGPLDARTGLLYHPVNFTDDDIPLKELLERRFGVSATVQNDANVAALGEWLHGGHGPTEHLIYITVSTGVGAGIISHGRLIDGFNTTAGEIGHTIIDPTGPPCEWGHRGCVEIICSGTSIARAAQEQLQAGRLSALVEPFTAEDVVSAAKQGDELAREVFFHAADTLGLAIVNLVHLLSPEIVVIGGGVAQAGDLLFDRVRACVRRYAMPLTGRGLRIEPAGLGQDAGLIGAIALAMRQSSAVQEGQHGT